MSPDPSDRIGTHRYTSAVVGCGIGPPRSVRGAKGKSNRTRPSGAPP